MTTIQLDIAHDCTIGEFFEMVENLDLKFKVLQVYGPAGGNPLIEFTGSKTSIRILEESFEA
jgi:hypothetical protein